MKRQEAIDKLVNAVKERPYGDVMTFDSIGYIIDQKHGSVSYGDILQAARKRLELAGRMIVNVRGIGYKVCPPDSYTGEGVRKMRQGAKRIDRGTKILNHAPVNDRSQPAREAYNRVSDRMNRLQAAMAGASVEIHMLEASKNPLQLAK
jgi:alkylated DNA nucleotide flippase Atl1